MTRVKDIAELLETHGFTRELAPEHRRVIAGCARNVRFRAGEYVFREGGAADWFYLIRHGKVALETIVPGRGRTLIHTVTDDQVLGVSWLFPPHRWTFDARAVAETRAIAFDAACLRGKCDADHDLGYTLMRAFAPKLIQRMQAARLQLADLYGDPNA